MLLAADTSTQMLGLALYDGAGIISEMTWRTNNHHTVALSPGLQTFLQRTGVTPSDLTALGVALGPGSFTSLRIGLAVIKGLALALRLPVIGIPSLDFLAAAQPESEIALAAVLQVGRTRLAVGTYLFNQKGWTRKGEINVMTAAELAATIREPTVISGELSAQDRQVLGRKWKNVLLASPANSLRRPSFLAELAWKRFQNGDTDDPITLAPIYVHFGEAIPV
jgi:tRNA threonylcarbamoyladenosine biosynthesis protein TsaB